MDLEKMTVVQLKEYAKQNEIALSGLTRREDIIQRILDETEGHEMEEVDEQEAVKEYAPLEDFEEVKKDLEMLKKKLAEVTIHSLKLVRRYRRFVNFERTMGKYVSNPLDLSLEKLEKVGYCDVINSIDDYIGDSEPSTENYDEYKMRLDKELDAIEEMVAENYHFKIPEKVFQESISLEEFLGLTNAIFEGGILRMNENTLNLDEKKTKKASLVIGKHIIRFVYFGGAWLISAD